MNTTDRQQLNDQDLCGAVAMEKLPAPKVMLEASRWLAQKEMSRAKLSQASELAIPFSVFLLLYTFTLCRTVSASGDSIYYLDAIDRGTDLFHRHHLLYNALAWLWMAFWKLLRVQADSAILVSELNAIFGALGLCVFYSILRHRLKADRLTALLGTSLPAFSYGFWFYSGCVEPYIIPLFFLLLSFSLLISEHVDRNKFVLVGFLNGIAVLFHQTYVLFAAVVFLAALYNHRPHDNPWWKSFGYYVLTAVPTAAIPYLLVIFGVVRSKSLKDAWYWTTLYARISSYWYPLAFSTLIKAGIGLGRAFIGSHFIFLTPPIRTLAERVLEGFYLADEAYLVRNLGRGVAYLLLASSAVLFLVLAISLVVRLSYWSSLSLPQRRMVYLLLLWIAVYGSFFFFYSPTNLKLWIPQSVCFWMIFLILLLGPKANPEESSRSVRTILASVATLIFFINFAGSIRFTRDRANDYYYARVAPLVELSNQRDLVIVGRSWILEEYMHRYGKAQVLSLSSVYEKTGASSQSVHRVRSAINDKLAQGSSVFISQEAVDWEKETVEYYGGGIMVFNALWETYRQRWSKKAFQTNVVYVLQ